MKYFFRLGIAALISGIASTSFIACSDDDSTPAIDTPTNPDASGGQDASAHDASDASDASAPDAAEAGDATTDAPAPTRQTALTADINSVSRPLDRAQFGDEKNEAGVQLFHVEAHSGGDPACPSDEMTSFPVRTLIVTRVPRGVPGTTYTRDDGVRVSFLDFTSEQLPGKPTTSATALTVTIVAMGSEATPADVELEVSATFAEGTVTGRVFAAHCESMDE